MKLKTGNRLTQQLLIASYTACNYELEPNVVTHTMSELSSVDYKACTIDVPSRSDVVLLLTALVAKSSRVRLLAHLLVKEWEDVGVSTEAALTSSINSLNVYGRSVIQCVIKSQHICNTLPTNFTDTLFYYFLIFSKFVLALLVVIIVMFYSFYLTKFTWGDYDATEDNVWLCSLLAWFACGVADYCSSLSFYYYCSFYCNCKLFVSHAYYRRAICMTRDKKVNKPLRTSCEYKFYFDSSGTNAALIDLDMSCMKATKSRMYWKSIIILLLLLLLSLFSVCSLSVIVLSLSEVFTIFLFTLCYI